jgi:predicted DNA-binding transcriptional regulator AlpA
VNETPPIAVTIKEAMRLSGLGLNKIYEKISDGTLESSSIGKRRLVMYASLLQMINAGRSHPAETKPNWTPPSPASRHNKPAPTMRRRRAPVAGAPR